MSVESGKIQVAKPKWAVLFFHFQCLEPAKTPANIGALHGEWGSGQA